MAEGERGPVVPDRGPVGVQRRRALPRPREPLGGLGVTPGELIVAGGRRGRGGARRGPARPRPRPPAGAAAAAWPARPARRRAHGAARGRRRTRWRARRLG